MSEDKGNWKLYVLPLAGSALFLWYNLTEKTWSATTLYDIGIFGIETYAIFVVTSLVQTFCYVMWHAMVEPYVHEMRKEPLQTLLGTLALIAVLLLSGWCFSMLGTDDGQVHCEPDPRSGVWCE